LDVPEIKKQTCPVKAMSFLIGENILEKQAALYNPTPHLKPENQDLLFIISLRLR